MSHLSFSSRSAVFALAIALASVGCASSHAPGGVDPGGDGSVVARDGSVSAPDGSVSSRDGSIALGDGSVWRDGALVGPDGAVVRDWVEVCVSTCRHAVGCGALGLDTVANCTSDCAGAEASFTIPGCRDLAYQALTCLEGLACPDLAGLNPDETVCAPHFARLNRTCGGG